MVVVTVGTLSVVGSIVSSESQQKPAQSETGACRRVAPVGGGNDSRKQELHTSLLVSHV